MEGEGKARGLLIRGGRSKDGEKGEGGSPWLLWFPPGSRGARIFTGQKHIATKTDNT